MSFGTSGGIGGTTGTTDNAITRADGTGGSTLQGSLATIDDGGNAAFTGIQATTDVSVGAYLRIGSSTLLHGEGDGVVSINNGPVTQSVFLAVDAASTLALRNGVNAQTLNVYNTFTDASNYERATFVWTGNQFVLGPDKAGTGVYRDFILSGATIQFAIAGVGIKMALKATGVINFSSMPTSSSGLSSGDVWSNLGILTIVP